MKDWVRWSKTLIRFEISGIKSGRSKHLHTRTILTADQCNEGMQSAKRFTAFVIFAKVSCHLPSVKRDNCWLVEGKRIFCDGAKGELPTVIVRSFCAYLRHAALAGST